MPKNAVNYYNLRKGLYLKNQGRGMSGVSRQPIKMVGSYDQATAKSTGILNAYGEIATSKENESGVADSQANLFHRNINSTKSMTMTSPISQGSAPDVVSETPLSAQVQSEPTQVHDIEQK